MLGEITGTSEWPSDVYLAPILDGDGTVIRLRASDTVWSPPEDAQYTAANATA